MIDTYILKSIQYTKGDDNLPKPIENSERISTFVTPEQLSRLRVRAKSKGMTVSGFIRMLIINEIDMPSNSLIKDSTASVDELFAQLSGETY